MSTDAQIETEIQAKGLTAPRVTPADIDANIVTEFYINPRETTLDALRFQFLTDDHSDPEVRGKLRTIFERMAVMSTAAVRAEVDEMMAVPGDGAEPLSMITFCVLVLRNGHRIVGVNEGPVSAANFDADLGRKLARQKAIDQVWPLMGYELKERLHQAERAPHPLDRA